MNKLKPCCEDIKIQSDIDLNNCRVFKQAINYTEWNTKSAWEMFRRLHRDYGIRFLSKLINGKKSIICWIINTPKQQAIKRMQEIEKEINK